MKLKSSIKSMIRNYEQMLRNTNNISMIDVINGMIENLNTLLAIAEAQEGVSK